MFKTYFAFVLSFVFIQMSGVGYGQIVFTETINGPRVLGRITEGRRPGEEPTYSISITSPSGFSPNVISLLGQSSEQSDSRGFFEILLNTPNFYGSTEITSGISAGVTDVTAREVGIPNVQFSLYQTDQADLTISDFSNGGGGTSFPADRVVREYTVPGRRGTTGFGLAFTTNSRFGVDSSGTSRTGQVAVILDQPFLATTNLQDLLKDGLNGKTINDFVKITNRGLFAGDTNPFNPETGVQGTSIQTCFTDPECGFSVGGVGGRTYNFLELLQGARTTNGGAVHFGWINELKLPPSIRGFVVDDISLEDAIAGRVKYDPETNKVGMDDNQGNFVAFTGQRQAAGFEIDPPVRSARASSTSFVHVGSGGEAVVLHQGVSGNGVLGFDSFKQYYNVNPQLFFPGEFFDAPALSPGTYTGKEATSFRTELVAFDPQDPSKITRLGFGFRWQSTVEGTLVESRTVQIGDTLSEIAAEYNVTVEDILLNNLENEGIVNRDTIITGTVLNLPNRFGSGTISFLANQTPVFVTSGSVSDLVFIDTILGDVNQDGVVNFLDISLFISVLSSGEFQAEADCNEDGEVSFLDIAPFIEILARG